jgi:methylated-DNA-[protein]-cysteine S-methyltransferase
VLCWTLLTPASGVEITLEADDTALRRLYFGRIELAGPRDDEHPILRQAARELEEYFAGRRREFSVPVAPEGTEFQLAVWAGLTRIPYGATWSYAQLAQAIGRPQAVRAVGAANGANPIGIIIPCHRVIGSDGSLTGFGGGLPLKRRLLELEGALPASSTARQSSLFEAGS